MGLRPILGIWTSGFHRVAGKCFRWKPPAKRSSPTLNAAQPTADAANFGKTPVNRDLSHGLSLLDGQDVSLAGQPLSCGHELAESQVWTAGIREQARQVRVAGEEQDLVSALGEGDEFIRGDSGS